MTVSLRSRGPVAAEPKLHFRSRRRRAELDGEAEPHVIPTVGASQLAVGIVETEVPCELVYARFAGISAISPLLLGSEKRDRHPFSRKG